MTQHNPLTVDQYRSLIKTAETQSPRNLFTVILLGHTGMRATVAAQFEPEWLDEENQTITIPND